MKRKNILFIFAIILISFNFVHINALTYRETQESTMSLNDEEKEFTVATCTNDENEKTLNIKWNGRRDLIGAIYTEYEIYEDGEDKIDETYDNKADADAAASEFINKWRRPACCDWTDPKDGDSCKGSAACTKPTCEPTARQVESGSRTYCSCTNVTTEATIVINSTSATCSDYCSNTGFDTGSGTLRKLGNKYIGSCFCKKTTSGASKNKESGKTCTQTCTAAGYNTGSETTKTTASTVYDVKCTLPKRVPTGKYRQTERNLYTLWYEMDIMGVTYDGDPVYCLMPGAIGPDAKGRDYKTDIKFDVSQCQDQYTRTRTLENGKVVDEDAVQCGLAQILYETYDCNKDTGKCTSKGTYSNAAITLALRLWMAAYSESYSLGSQSAEEDILGFIPREEYYNITANLIKNKGTRPYDTSNAAITRDKVRGRIGCAEKEKDAGKEANHTCVIDQAIELFNKVENVKKEDYLGGINFDKKVPVYSYEEDQGVIDIKFDDDGTFQRIKKACDDINDPNCQTEIRLFYGNEDVTDKFSITNAGEHFCDKHTCRAKVKMIKEVCIAGGMTEIHAVIIFKNWQRNYGYVRFYSAANGSNRYQKMVSFGLKLEQCETKENKTKPVRIEGTFEIPCPCEESTCDDLSTTETPDATCNTSKTIKDANMNCIVHACDNKDIVKYNVTSQYDVNPLVCTLYQREENEFTLPGETSVYSGMQFSYNVKTAADGTKYTSIVKRRRQITSDINYKYWKEEYDRKQDLMKLAIKQGYSSSYKQQLTAEINNWVDALNKCNFRDNELVNSIKSNLKCENGNNCIELDVKYKYSPNETEDRVSRLNHNISYSTETYYCKGSDCYQYKKNEAVELKRNYSTTTLSCTNSSGRSCEYTVPNNDYATIIATEEYDYYMPFEYKVEVYSGKVLDKSTNTSASTAPLAKYSYPIGVSTKTGNVDINFIFSNIKNVNRKTDGTKYDSACRIKVYNITSSYNCYSTNGKGGIDLSKCSDDCYEIKDGVPVIKDSCINWTNSSTTKNGFVFRSVDLSNLFPNDDVQKNGITSRNATINWTKEDVEEIEKTASDIYTNSDYLNYRFVLTPETIKAIKEYNKSQNASGGYLNSTLTNCELVNDSTGLQLFRRCQSDFLNNKLKTFTGVEISGNKVGVN